MTVIGLLHCPYCGSINTIINFNRLHDGYWSASGTITADFTSEADDFNRLHDGYWSASVLEKDHNLLEVRFQSSS